MIADFSAAGDQFGWIAFSSATMPATCGVAIDVPDLILYEFPCAAKMLAPGAAMSGCGGSKRYCETRGDDLFVLTDC